MKRRSTSTRLHGAVSQTSVSSYSEGSFITNASTCILHGSCRNWFLLCRFKYGLFVWPRKSVKSKHPKAAPLLPAHRILHFSLNHVETRWFSFVFAKHIRTHFPHTIILLSYNKAYRNTKHSQTEGNPIIACSTSKEHGLWWTLQFSPAFCYLLSLRPIQSLRHHILTHSQCSSHRVGSQVSHPYKVILQALTAARKSYVL
jgi:hypothetical protein